MLVDAFVLLVAGLRLRGVSELFCSLWPFFEFRAITSRLCFCICFNDGFSSCRLLLVDTLVVSPARPESLPALLTLCSCYAAMIVEPLDNCCRMSNDFFFLISECCEYIAFLNEFQAGILINVGVACNQSLRRDTL